MLWEKTLYLKAKQGKGSRWIWTAVWYAWAGCQRVLDRATAAFSGRGTGIDYTRRYQNCILHGACLIYSEKYIQKREYGFDPETFLYMEEDILHYWCMQWRAVMIYDPSILIYHAEDVSTQTKFKARREQKIFKAEQMIKSMNYFLKLIS